MHYLSNRQAKEYDSPIPFSGGRKLCNSESHLICVDHLQSSDICCGRRGRFRLGTSRGLCARMRGRQLLGPSDRKKWSPVLTFCSDLCLRRSRLGFLSARSPGTNSQDAVALSLPRFTVCAGIMSKCEKIVNWPKESCLIEGYPR
jgi:hypothetical protein